MNKMEVTIMGQTYLLGCAEGGESALSKAVSLVDKEMCSIRDSGKVKARERIAVLAALNLAAHLVDQAQASSPAPLMAETHAADGNATELTLTPAAEVASLLDLDALVRRLDEALAQDGQLL